MSTVQISAPLRNKYDIEFHMITWLSTMSTWATKKYFALVSSMGMMIYKKTEQVVRIKIRGSLFVTLEFKVR